MPVLVSSLGDVFSESSFCRGHPEYRDSHTDRHSDLYCKDQGVNLLPLRHTSIFCSSIHRVTVVSYSTSICIAKCSLQFLHQKTGVKLW